MLFHPWTRAHEWSWVRWLTPAETVELIQPDGERQPWESHLDGRLVRVPANVKHVFRGCAMALPADVVLHRAMALPLLEPTQLHRAIELEAYASSPFATQDLCWGYATRVTPNGRSIEVQLAMASRRQIRSCLQDKTWQKESARSPEVWAPLGAQAADYVVLPGFGEAARQARQRKGMALRLLALGALALVLVLIAITPTLQLRARAVEAVHAYDDLHQRARQVVASREGLTRATERIVQIEGLEHAGTAPARVIENLTTALGDDTYLTALRIEGTKVVLDGQTTNAAQLMQALGREPGIQEVIAPVPATRPFGSGKDIFKIEFRFDPAVFARGGEQASDPSAAPRVPSAPGASK